MEHVAKNGDLKVLDSCTLPLTAREVVNLVITDLAVVEVRSHEMHLLEIAPGVGLDDVRSATGSDLISDANLKRINLSHGQRI